MFPFQRALALPIAALLFASASPDAQAAPTEIRAEGTPVATTIRLAWRDNANDEMAYVIERDGVNVRRLPANTTVFVAAGLAANTTYVFRVGAVKGANTTWSKKAWALTTATREFWPIGELAANQYQVGYNYCDFFENYNPTDYHFGVDTMRVGNDATGKKKVIMPVNGRIHRAWGAGNADLNLEFATRTEYFLLSHLQNTVMGAADVGGWVMAGVQVGEVWNNAFLQYGAHVHCNRDVMPYDSTKPGNMRHFLELFTVATLKDPRSAIPVVLDATMPSNLDADTDAVQYKGDGAGAYFTTKTAAAPPQPQPASAFIVSGHVDIVAEAQDPMGHPAKPSALHTASYWIEAKRRASHDVRAMNDRYRLHKCSPHLFDGNTDRTHQVFEVGKKKDYNKPNPAAAGAWTVDFHLIVTNTRGTNGAMSNVDPNQHWNTKAKEMAGGQPNGAGNPDAGKASEAWFPDGPYRVHVFAGDLVRERGYHSDVWVENFPPAVADSYGVLTTGQDGVEQVCGAVVVFSEAMNRTSVQNAITLTDNIGNAVPFSLTWTDDGREVTVAPNSFAGYHLRLGIDASVAKDLSGGAAGTGAFLDSVFGDANHNGVANGAADNVVLTIECAG